MVFVCMARILVAAPPSFVALVKSHVFYNHGAPCFTSMRRNAIPSQIWERTCSLAETGATWSASQEDLPAVAQRGNNGKNSTEENYAVA